MPGQFSVAINTQGAPTSPIISNFIGHILDLKLSKMAKKGNCSYTRYADDLTFSTNEQRFPSAIARLIVGTTDKWVAGDGLLARVYASGFRVNHDKSRMQLSFSRQEATGLVVNQTVNVPASYYKVARAMCDHLFTGGTCYEMKGGKWTLFPPHRLQGRLYFIYSVRRSRLKLPLDHVSKKQFPIEYRKREELFCKDQKTFTSIYRNMLNYTTFWGNEKPIVVGEGITDGLYIRSAIKTSGHTFPKLYDPSDDGEVLVNFYKHTDKRKFYQIGEGAAPLKVFIADYLKLMEPFKTRPKQPVILIVDNDKEGREVLNSAGKRWKKDTSLPSPFYHLVANLYIIPLPKLGAKDTCIENLFDPTWLAAQDIGGRKFTKKNEFDSATHFGKAELVGQIVRPKREVIDWSGFQPLLNAIQDAISDYEVKVATTT